MCFEIIKKKKTNFMQKRSSRAMTPHSNPEWRVITPQGTLKSWQLCISRSVGKLQVALMNLLQFQILRNVETVTVDTVLEAVAKQLKYTQKESKSVTFHIIIHFPIMTIFITYFLHLWNEYRLWNEFSFHTVHIYYAPLWKRRGILLCTCRSVCRYPLTLCNW